MKADRDYIDATMTLTYGQTFNEIIHRERIERINSKSLVRMLEKEAQGQPLILILASTKPGNVSRGDRRFRMVEAKHILVYESRQYQELEQERVEKEDREQKKRENEKLKLQRRAAVVKEAMRIKAGRDTEEQGRSEQFKEDQESNLLREAEKSLVEQGLLEPKKKKVTINGRR